jgi:hypothetical protein
MLLNDPMARIMTMTRPSNNILFLNMFCSLFSIAGWDRFTAARPSGSRQLMRVKTKVIPFDGLIYQAAGPGIPIQRIQLPHSLQTYPTQRVQPLSSGQPRSAAYRPRATTGVG